MMSKRKFVHKQKFLQSKSSNRNLHQLTFPTPLFFYCLKIFEKLVKIVPRVGPKETAHSVIAVRIARGRGLATNNEFKNVNISIEVFVPMTQWIIKDTNLRPFAIMGEVQKSLNGKKIEGLGKLTGGDFSLNFLTEEISAYEQTFVLTSYD